VGIAERAHFTLAVVVHHLPARVQVAIHMLNYLLIALFGGLIAWFGLGLVRLNMMLVSPALEINLGWLYACTVVGGILIILYAVAVLREPVAADHTPADVRE
jgi:TRAP-type C4-dicarboxylate transport system permease small subunit